MLEQLLPHRGEALFLREIVAHDADSVTAWASVKEDSPYVAHDLADALLAIEIAAQAAAAHAGLVSGAGETGTRQGYLVGVKTLTLLAPSFATKTQIAIRVRLLGRAAQLATWSFVFGSPERPIAEGEISVWS